MIYDLKLLCIQDQSDSSVARNKRNVGAVEDIISFIDSGYYIENKYFEILFKSTVIDNRAAIFLTIGKRDEKQ